MNIVTYDQFKNNLAKRQSGQYPDHVDKVCTDILSQIMSNGDEALIELTQRFDGVDLSKCGIEVSREDWNQYAEQVKPDLKQALELAANRLTKFHRQQIKPDWITTEPGIIAGQLIRPVDRAGIYIPGGRAVYPSSVLMTAIPAVVAGVKEVVACTPPGQNGKIHPLIALACKLAGVDRLFRAGGAQAICALALGTDIIARVDFIAGPGNAYVAAAKRLVSGRVGIDSEAGPSEIAVIADQSARISWVGRDVLAQAEHDPDSAVIVVTTCPQFAGKLLKWINEHSALSNRASIVAKSLETGMIVTVSSLAQASEAVNQWAPEHASLHVADPWALASRIRNAGAIMIGSNTPVACADYAAGPNHVLPTGGTARFSSALGCDLFMKKTNVLHLSPDGLSCIGPASIKLAQAEGLHEHALSIHERMKGSEGDVDS